MDLLHYYYDDFYLSIFQIYFSIYFDYLYFLQGCSCINVYYDDIYHLLFFYFLFRMLLYFCCCFCYFVIFIFIIEYIIRIFSYFAELIVLYANNAQLKLKAILTKGKIHQFIHFTLNIIIHAKILVGFVEDYSILVICYFSILYFYFICLFYYLKKHYF